MKKTLYLLRKPAQEIDPALFLPTESEGDVVLLEENGVEKFPYTGGRMFSVTPGVGTTLSYDELVKKIFECDRTVVI